MFTYEDALVEIQKQVAGGFNSLNFTEFKLAELDNGIADINFQLCKANAETDAYWRGAKDTTIGKTLTETAISAKIDLDPKVLKLKKQLLEAKAERRIYQAFNTVEEREFKVKLSGKQ